MTIGSETFAAHRHAAERAEEAWAAYEAVLLDAKRLHKEALDAAAEYRALTGSRILQANASSKRSHTRLSPTFLQEVADVYKSTKGGRFPTQNVAAHYSAAYSTASRWIWLARKAGYLEPTTQGVGGLAQRG